jgi:hypothetical protein
MFLRRDVNMCNHKGNLVVGFAWSTGRAVPLGRAAR